MNPISFEKINDAINNVKKHDNYVVFITDSDDAFDRFVGRVDRTILGLRCSSHPRCDVLIGFTKEKDREWEFLLKDEFSKVIWIERDNDET